MNRTFLDDGGGNVWLILPRLSQMSDFKRTFFDISVLSRVKIKLSNLYMAKIQNENLNCWLHNIIQCILHVF